jgi:hypothetical protein
VISLVKQRDSSWWKLWNGTIERVAIKQVLNADRDGSLHSVFWVVYSKCSETHDEAPDERIPEQLSAAIGDDNLTMESEQLSLMRPDEAAPSVTQSVFTSDSGMAMEESVESLIAPAVDNAVE